MKKIYRIIFIILITIYYASSVYAADYYMSAAGSNTSPYDTWAKGSTTIANINALNIASGSNIYLRAGDTFDDTILDLSSSSGSNLTINIEGIDGDGKTLAIDGKPKIDIDEISNNWPTQLGALNFDHNNGVDADVETLTIKNIQLEGQFQAQLVMIYCENVDNITLDGVDANGHGGDSYESGNKYIKIVSGTGDIEIKNSTIQNLGGDTIPNETSGDIYAIEVRVKTSGSVLIHDNVIHDINADGIQVISVYGITAKIYENEIYNCGENAVDIKESHDFQVYENNFYRESDFTGHGGDPNSTSYPLINIISSNENGGTPGTSDDNLIYNNYLHDDGSGSSAIGVKLGSDAYGKCNRNKIYHNYFNKNGVHVLLYTSSASTEIFNNIFIKSYVYGLREQAESDATCTVYNNSFYNAAGNGIILRLQYSYSTYRNNAFHQSDSGDVIVDYEYGGVTINNNVYYNSTVGNQNIIDWDGTIYDESEQADWISAGHADAIFSDPKYNDPGNNDLTLQNDSPCIGNGVSIGQDSLDPNTALPPDTVSTIVYNDCIGAYGFKLAISNIFPADESTGINITAKTSWSNPDPARYTSNTVYFDSIDGRTTKVVDEGNVSEYDPPGDLGHNTEYLWSVDFTYDDGVEEGNVYSFTTSGGPPQVAGSTGSIVSHPSGSRMVSNPNGQKLINSP